LVAKGIWVADEAKKMIEKTKAIATSTATFTMSTPELIKAGLDYAKRLLWPAALVTLIAAKKSAFTSIVKNNYPNPETVDISVEDSLISVDAPPMSLDNGLYDIDLNTVHYIEALAAFNLIEKVTTTDTSLMIKLKTAYVKLDSINEIISACKAIHALLPIKAASNDIAGIHEWIDIVTNIHPLVQDEIKDLMFFKPISNEVGSRILGYYPDTQSLEANEWNSIRPKALRRSLEVKLKQESLALVQDNYQSLNSKLVKSLSTEFYNRSNKSLYFTMLLQGRATFANINIIGPGKGLAPDFHMIGDSGYPTIVSMVETPYWTLVLGLLKGAMLLINYLHPVSINGTVVKDTFVITPENNTLVVNRRKDYVGREIVFVNNDVLIPEELE